MQGVATFAPDGEGLIYREEGELRLGKAAPIRAERSYRWRTGADHRLEVLFEDGRPFHGFSPAKALSAQHFCDPDTYEVTYDFSGWPAWRAVWRVRGPRKDYEMTTDYAPLALGPGMGDTDIKSGVEDGRGA